ncbi:MAG: SAM-dependent methyltransferase [Elusimicrobia bacterium]|nr:SAM-dependent methyltransferase [Elusimicrobiota bacterium]
MRTFRDFMESALYDPERGFYSTRAQSADFYTAPELHPAFGAVLADRLAALLRREAAAAPGAGLTLVEAGCGDGTLAAQVARRLRERHADAAAGLRFALVERSRRDLTTAARRLTAFGLRVEAATSLDSLPRFRGALYSNELIDALPVHLLEKRAGEVREVYVDAENRTAAGPLSRPELEDAAAALRDTLEEGERHAVSLEARAWIAGAAARLESGFLVTVDYGKRFPSGAPNPPRAYRRHAQETDLTSRPGERDLTASVDFEVLIAAGAAAGLALESYQSLSRWLLDGGIQTWLGPDAGDDLALYKDRAQIKTLLHPEGMGEAFKVLVQRKAAA